MNHSLIDFLKTRRSDSVKFMSDPAPTSEQLREILALAARVPDHGKYVPWYFVVFSGQARAEAGHIFSKIFQKNNPDAVPEKLEIEAERFLRAPVVIAVVSSFREGKNPLWEQILSAGAACYNLTLAAKSYGFAANWLTEWVCYDQDVKKELGIDATDHIAGLIYIGTSAQKNEERERPDLDKITTIWSKDSPIKTGKDTYGLKGQGLPKAGFKLPPS
jgi:nitroreductase